MHARCNTNATTRPMPFQDKLKSGNSPDPMTLLLRRPSPRSFRSVVRYFPAISSLLPSWTVPSGSTSVNWPSFEADFLMYNPAAKSEVARCKRLPPNPHWLIRSRSSTSPAGLRRPAAGVPTLASHRHSDDWLVHGGQYPNPPGLSLVLEMGWPTSTKPSVSALSFQIK